MTRACACSRTAPRWGARTRCAAPRSSPARRRASIRDLHFSQGIANATQPVRTAPRPDIGLESRVCVPIRCQGALFGYLWLIDADQSLTTPTATRRSARRRRSAPRCTAATSSRRPQREHELKLLEAAARRRRHRTRGRGARARDAGAAGDRRGHRRARDAPVAGRGHGARGSPSAPGSAWRWTSSAARCRGASRSASCDGDHGVMLVALDGRHGTLDEIARARAGRTRSGLCGHAGADRTRLLRSA